jgi:hypothetical protein
MRELIFTARTRPRERISPARWSPARPEPKREGDRFRIGLALAA